MQNDFAKIFWQFFFENYALQGIFWKGGGGVYKNKEKGR